MPTYLPGNTITLSVIYNKPMIITGANTPYIYASNTTHSNAFQLNYNGVGNGTNVLEFTANAFANTTGNGEIGVSNNSTLIQANGCSINSLAELVFQNNPGLYNLIGIMGEGLIFGSFWDYIYAGNSFTSNQYAGGW
jgi:hypothetical protein